MKTKETFVKQKLYNKKYNSYAEWNGSAWEDKSIVGAYFHSIEKANANGWFEEASTRGQALAWWGNLPFNSSNNVSKTSYCKKYYGNFTLARTYDTLTDREIEEIWRKEVGDLKLHKGEVVDESYPKEFQDAYLKTNQKQFQNPNKELMSKYLDKFDSNGKMDFFNVLINKFSEEDKLKGLFHIAQSLDMNVYQQQYKFELYPKLK